MKAIPRSPLILTGLIALATAFAEADYQVQGPMTQWHPVTVTFDEPQTRIGKLSFSAEIVHFLSR